MDPENKRFHKKIEMPEIFDKDYSQNNFFDSSRRMAEMKKSKGILPSIKTIEQGSSLNMRGSMGSNINASIPNLDIYAEE
jgi:hypothetical protein